MPPDTLALDAAHDTAALAQIQAAEDARRWLDRAAKCEREGCMWRHCMDRADEALERAGLVVIGDIGALLKEGEHG